MSSSGYKAAKPGFILTIIYLNSGTLFIFHLPFHFNTAGDRGLTYLCTKCFCSLGNECCRYLSHEFPFDASNRLFHLVPAAQHMHIRPKVMIGCLSGNKMASVVISTEHVPGPRRWGGSQLGYFNPLFLQLKSVCLSGI